MRFRSLLVPVVLMTLASIPSPTTAQEPDWAAAARRPLAHLQAMIRMNTVNPPGNELQVARYLDSTLKAAGIETHLVRADAGPRRARGAHQGQTAASARHDHGHMDVVGVERGHRSVDPFAARIKGEYLYGRGAIDDNGMPRRILETMLLLKRHVVDKGDTLSRDVIFVANSDEEHERRVGEWVADREPSRADQGEFALNEGGPRAHRRREAAVRRRAEHGEGAAHRDRHGADPAATRRYRWRATRSCGSVVRSRRSRTTGARAGEPDDAGVLLRARARCGRTADERTAMADVASQRPRRQLRGAANPRRTAVFDAVLRNGISATICQSGIRSNVIRPTLERRSTFGRCPAVDRRW
jgi:hypothetical protein